MTPGVTSSEETTLKPTPGTTLPPCSTTDVSYFEDPDDCTKYWECYNGELAHLQCPDGLYWNDSSKKCDIPENSDCESNQYK